MTPASVKDIQSILALPFTGVQTLLTQKLLTNAFTDAERDSLVEDIRNLLTPDEKKNFADEEQNIARGLKADYLPREPRLNRPEFQLLWAAHLTHQLVNGNKPLESTRVWRQLLNSNHARHELTRHAFYISRDQFNPRTRLVWGVPRSTFFFDPVNNKINIDFLMSMIGGFENVRSIIFHEIGHSKLTREFTEVMRNIRSEMEKLQEKGRQEKLTAEEYARQAGYAARWDLLFRLFDEAENSPVNRYAINTGPKLQQDFAQSLNIVETTIAGAATKTLPDATAATDASALFDNLKRAVRMSLYKNNELFTDDQQGWEQMGVRREWIKALPVDATATAPTPEESFAHLMELCGGMKGLEHLQPGTIDRMRGTGWLEKRTNEFAAQRNAIIDEIWTRYAEPIIEPLIQAQQKQMQEMVEQVQEAMKMPPQDGPSMPGQGQPGQGVTGDDAAEGAGGQAPGDPAQQDEVRKGSSKKEEKDKPAKTDDADADGAGDKDKEKTAGAAGDDEKKDDEEEYGPASNRLKVEDVEMPDIPLPPPTPRDVRQIEPEESDDGDTMEGLLKDEDDEKDGQNGRMKQTPDVDMLPQRTPMDKGGAQAGSSRGMARPKIGDWSNYQACVAQFAPEIRQAQTLLVQIQEKQARPHRRITNDHELLPASGDMTLFDVAKQEVLVTKLLTGEKIVENDAKRFSVVEESRIPASIDIVVQIDGSGSMFGKYGGWRYSPIQAGMQTACVLNEAAKKPRNSKKPKAQEADINVWTVLWGNDPPMSIAKPGDKPEDVGKAIAGMEESNGWGTNLEPAVRYTTKMLAEHKKSQNALTGFVHQITVSDGDIGDPTEAVNAIDSLLSNSSLVTFDVVIVNERDHTQMGETIKILQKKHGDQRVKIVRCKTPEQVHASVLVLLRERMLATAPSDAVPFRKRMKTFQKAYAGMNL